MSDRHTSAANAEQLGRLTQLVTLLTEQIEGDQRSTAKRVFRSARAQCWNDLAESTPDNEPLGQASRLAFQQLAVHDSVEEVAGQLPAAPERFAPFESFAAATNNNDHPLRHDGELPADGFESP
ncbi:hypothetical protein EV191_10573 [Tamaricihabitans halophyticus]|uniref:Uncharacterized protein n=1 Tax=Tamaricihabitans halophyticus TaxID=1262583 RepID=A0A4R2R0N8_9PSEU|nr:hypothetical protein [Tamaricihabitans halophyticus]TCP53011.1 hypothetical protein EV191_10573 [Tamaricihabitans halophyticus]